LLIGDTVRTEKNGDLGDAWRKLLEQFKKLCAEARLQNGKTGHIATGMGQTLHESVGYRVTAGNEDDRDDCGQLLHHPGGRAAIGDNQVRHRLQQLSRGSPDPFSVACSPSMIDLKVLSDLPAQ
jgi:hypothetical protein